VEDLGFRSWDSDSETAEMDLFPTERGVGEGVERGCYPWKRARLSLKISFLHTILHIIS